MTPPQQAVDWLIRVAIRERRLLEFRLQNHNRIAEPHVYGTHDDALQLLVYQVGGESRSGKLPDWRRANVGEIQDLRVLDDRFPGPRLPAERHKDWDTVIAVVA